MIIQNNGSRQIRIPEVTNVDNQEKSEENAKEHDAQITTSEIAEFLNVSVAVPKIFLVKNLSIPSVKRPGRLLKIRIKEQQLFENF